MRYLHERGCALSVAVATTGASGVDDTDCAPPTWEAKAALREAEQRASCGFFGLPQERLRFLRLPADAGGHVAVDAANVERVAAVLGNCDRRSCSFRTAATPTSPTSVSISCCARRRRRRPSASSSTATQDGGNALRRRDAVSRGPRGLEGDLAPVPPVAAAARSALPGARLRRADSGDGPRHGGGVRSGTPYAEVFELESAGAPRSPSR